MALPAYITRMPTLFPYRAEIPTAPVNTTDKAHKAAGKRLAVTESDKPGIMWVWARTQADAEAASQAMPALAFGPSK
jgi:hypothetical protein